MGEETKNHKDDNEDLELCGVIPFLNDEFGFNPGRFFELYLNLLNPENDFLFQRPRNSPTDSFNIHDFTESTIFVNSKAGRDQIPKMLKTLCEIVDCPILKNHSVRSTGITELRKLGYDVFDIMKISGHKNPSSLKNYVPPPNKSEQFGMGAALLTRKKIDLKSTIQSNQLSNLKKMKLENNEECGKAFASNFGTPKPTPKKSPALSVNLRPRPAKAATITSPPEDNLKDKLSFENNASNDEFENLIRYVQFHKEYRFFRHKHFKFVTKFAIFHESFNGF